MKRYLKGETMILKDVLPRNRLVLAIFSICITMHTVTYTREPLYIDTFYGSMFIEDDAVLDILFSQAMLRLKKINQYGIWAFIEKDNASYTRYEHSLGVYYLLHTFGASRKEAIFGLIHDISHTAFSHAADYMFNTVTHYKSYQDNILSWYVYNTDLKDILEKHNLLDLVDNEVQKTFTMLKNPLPNVCVDRLEYNVYGGFIENMLTKNDTEAIINSLIYTNNAFIFKNHHYAKQFALVSIKLSVDNWCNPINCCVYQETADMLLYALEHQLISSKDFHFSNDEIIWNTLYCSTDGHIQKHIERLTQKDISYCLGTENDYDMAILAKFRGIDPLILTDGGDVKRLSEVDTDFAISFADAKEYCTKTIYVKKTDH